MGVGAMVGVGGRDRVRYRVQVRTNVRVDVRFKLKAVVRDILSE